MPKFRWNVMIYSTDNDPVIVEAADVMCGAKGLIVLPPNKEVAQAMKSAYKVEVQALIEA